MVLVIISLDSEAIIVRPCLVNRHEIQPMDVQMLTLMAGRIFKTCFQTNQVNGAIQTQMALATSSLVSKVMPVPVNSAIQPLIGLGALTATGMATPIQAMISLTSQLNTSTLTETVMETIRRLEQ